MEFALSIGSARGCAAGFAAAFALACPSLAGADVFTSDFNPPTSNANQVQVVCAQKMQRNCVWNWQALADDSETPGTSGGNAPDDGSDTLLTEEATDALWPDFTLWADDIMYRRWTRPIGVGNPVFGDGPPGPSEEVPSPVVGDVPRAPSQEVLNLVAGGEQPVPSQQVPEPSSLALLLASMAVGIGVLASARRRSTQR